MSLVEDDGSRYEDHLADAFPVERLKLGAWNFAVRRSRGFKSPTHTWLAWAAAGYENLGNGPLDVPINVIVHANFGPSRDAALRGLIAEVFH